MSDYYERQSQYWFDECAKFIKERDTCLEDIDKLRKRNKELERENNNLKQSVSDYKDYAESHVANYLELKSLEHENKALRLQADTYFDEWQTVKNLYTTLTSHIRMKADANPGVSRYIDLVNYIDKLEQE